MTRIKIVLVLAVGALIVGCHAEPVPQNQSIALCIAPQDWPKLIAAMERFGQTKNLKLIGGIEELPDGKPLLNVALAQGYNYYFGDDLDLWVTSDPFRPNVISYGAVGRHNPIDRRQWELARSGLKAILSVATVARRDYPDPQCSSSASATQTPR